MGFTTVSVAHTGFTVSDLSASIAFWRDVFGFDVERRFELSGAFAAEVTGVADAAISAAVLVGPGHRIELLQYSAPRQRDHLRPRPCDVGSVHLAVDVDDMSAAVAACMDHGWTLAGTPQVMEVGARAGTRFAYLHDADGLTLELIQSVNQ
jgi:catechol 2,3-dioxygenase-like lactoylglutathione lyase family enzyme